MSPLIKLIILACKKLVFHQNLPFTEKKTFSFLWKSDSFITQIYNTISREIMRAEQLWGHTLKQSSETSFRHLSFGLRINSRKASHAGYRSRDWNSAGAFKSSFTKPLPHLSACKLWEVRVAHERRASRVWDRHASGQDLWEVLEVSKS